MDRHPWLPAELPSQSNRWSAQGACGGTFLWQSPTLCAYQACALPPRIGSTQQAGNNANGGVAPTITPVTPAKARSALPHWDGRQLRRSWHQQEARLLARTDKDSRHRRPGAGCYLCARHVGIGAALGKVHHYIDFAGLECLFKCQRKRYSDGAIDHTHLTGDAASRQFADKIDRTILTSKIEQRRFST